MTQEAKKFIRRKYPAARWNAHVEAAIDDLLLELRKAKRTAVVMACLFAATFVAGILTAVWLW